ncbi:hypothetical protein M758_6G103200 [Ceratodon purpureus]|uniref:Uncharacterized protein n=1 Tax=Ceratodon purpureus TaxID=3225 RepID=A0A8T0HCY4_CERPU|nr:hypothetical protein KC19_6G106900 [Ceratodon purpureus]KAG0613446.1 hypothetical protein M758_6G103200 [Ceratodon purpureus]
MNSFSSTPAGSTNSLKPAQTLNTSSDASLKGLIDLQNFVTNRTTTKKPKLCNRLKNQSKTSYKEKTNNSRR